jgi:hypothetical protein
MARERKQPDVGRPTVAERFLLRISSGKVIDGLWVGSEVDAERILPRVEEALGLIKTHDRARYDRMGRDLDRIWVRLLTSGAAQFSPRLWACMLDERFVMADTTDTAQLAAVIVHEATHARLWRCGFGYDEAERQRIEAICVRREMAFACTLPDGQRVRDSAADVLAISPSYWTDAASDDRHIKGSVEALRHLGWGWATPTLLTIRRLILVIRKWRTSNAASRADGAPRD